MANQLCTATGEAQIHHLCNVFSYVFSPAVKLIGFNPFNCLKLIFSDATLHLIAKVILGFQFVAFNIVLPSMLIVSLTMITLAKRRFIPSIKQNYGNIIVVRWCINYLKSCI